jgi:hypothetical protein
MGSFISEIPSISELVNVLLLCPSIAELIVSMSKIVDLSLNIPNELKGALKKNAINDILTTEIQTSIRNNEDTQEIKNKLKGYKS